MSKYFSSDFYTPETGPPLVIFGAGGLGREVLVLVQQLNEAGAGWTVAGFYDDVAPATSSIAGLPYLGTAADLNATTRPLAVAVAVGSPAGRAAAVSQLTSPRLHFPVLMHPGVAARPHQRLQVGPGCIVQQGCILTCDVTLGRFVLLNLGCTIGHDAVLEDFCSLMPHVDVGGGAHFETGTYFGTKATVIQGVRVGAHSILGAGAVAVRDVPAHVTAVGVPARIVKS